MLPRIASMLFFVATSTKSKLPSSLLKPVECVAQSATLSSFAASLTTLLFLLDDHLRHHLLRLPARKTPWTLTSHALLVTMGSSIDSMSRTTHVFNFLSLIIPSFTIVGQNPRLEPSGVGITPRRGSSPRPPSSPTFCPREMEPRSSSLITS